MEMGVSSAATVGVGTAVAVGAAVVLAEWRCIVACFLAWPVVPAPSDGRGVASGFNMVVGTGSVRTLLELQAGSPRAPAPKRIDKPNTANVRFMFSLRSLLVSRTDVRFLRHQLLWTRPRKKTFFT